MAAVSSIVAAVAAVAAGAYMVDQSQKAKKEAGDARNEQMRQQAQAEADLKEQNLRNDTETTQKKRRVAAMTANKQDAKTGRAGTVLGSGLTTSADAASTPPPAVTSKTLLGE